jgi:hypothetical protein
MCVNRLWRDADLDSWRIIIRVMTNRDFPLRLAILNNGQEHDSRLCGGFRRQNPGFLGKQAQNGQIHQSCGCNGDNGTQRIPVLVHI